MEGQSTTSINEEVNLISETLQGLIDVIFMQIKAFHGDVYGSVLRECKIRKSNSFKDINCRLDINVYDTFVQMLYIHFNVVKLPPRICTSYYGFTNRFKISHKGPLLDSLNNHDNRDSNESQDSVDSSMIILDICLLSRMDWLHLPCDFDVNLLAEDSTSLFLRVNHNALSVFVDKLNHVTKRISAKTFATLDAYMYKSLDTFINHIDRAEVLVKNGWLMDDSILGDRSWLLGMWLSLQVRGDSCRKSYSKRKLSLLMNCNECSLCHEKFNPCDIVINTKCNHNFHWSLTKQQGITVCRGLREWVKRGNSSCPLCRINVI